jgi:hypothetical protein
MRRDRRNAIVITRRENPQENRAQTTGRPFWRKAR